MNKLKDKQIRKAMEVLRKYTLPDALKPQYDGMTAYAIAELMLKAAENTEHEEMAKDLNARAEQVKINGKYPERDFDLEKGEQFSENDYNDYSD